MVIGAVPFVAWAMFVVVVVSYGLVSVAFVADGLATVVFVGVVVGEVKEADNALICDVRGDFHSPSPS